MTKYVVQRVQTQIIDTDDYAWGDDPSFDEGVAIELATEVEDGWETVDVSWLGTLTER